MSKIHRSESERSSGDHKTVGFLTHNFSWLYGQPRDRPIRKGWWGWKTFKDQSTVIYHLGGGGGWRILGGFTWFLREQKGGSVVTENPKGGITENFGRIQKGDHSICLENEGMGGGAGGSRKSSNVIRDDHFSEVTFKGGSAKFLNPKSFPLPKLTDICTRPDSWPLQKIP